MNQMEIFKNPEFGAIRAVEIDGEPWLVGKDVSLALGYTNPQKAIRDHVGCRRSDGERFVHPSTEPPSRSSTRAASIPWCCPVSSPKQSSFAGGSRLRCCPPSASTELT